MLRMGSHREQQSKGVDKKLEAKPGMRAHVDYTLSSGPNRLKELLPKSEAEALQQHPYAIIQGWQPRKGPVLESPLALCDAATLAQDDLIPTNLYFPDRTGQVYSVAHNPAQRWYYAKEMQTDELYLFVGYNSRQDGCARFVPHSSFQDPNTPADAPDRESIEFRAYVFWAPDS